MSRSKEEERRKTNGEKQSPLSCNAGHSGGGGGELKAILLYRMTRSRDQSHKNTQATGPLCRPTRRDPGILTYGGGDFLISLGRSFFGPGRKKKKKTKEGRIERVDKFALIRQERNAKAESLYLFLSRLPLQTEQEEKIKAAGGRIKSPRVRFIYHLASTKTSNFGLYGRFFIGIPLDVMWNTFFELDSLGV